MAAGEVTGKTESGLETLQGQYYNTPKYDEEGTDFDTAYCLANIGKQPEEYDGPQRYCVNRAARLEDGSHSHSCNFHGSMLDTDCGNDNLTPLGSIKHGMHATNEHLEEVFSEKDQQLYDWVMSWAGTYGWPSRDEDPSRYDDLESIAVNRVRIARSNKFILDEGEMKREEIYDENGNLREVDNAHALSEDVRLKRKLITDLKKELGLTPKAKSKMSTDEKTANAAEELAEVAGEVVLSGSDNGFDPNDEMFEDEST